MTWLRGITARHLRHLDRVEIDLAPPAGVERQHLVLIGTNGSGKTSLLAAMADELAAALEQRAHPAAQLDGRAGDPEKLDKEQKLAHLGRPLRLRWSPRAEAVAEEFAAGRLVLVHLTVPREVRWDPAPKPTPVDTDPRRPDVRMSPRLPQLLVNRKTEQTLARESGDPLRAKVHEAWLLRVQSALRKLLHQPELVLAFDAAGFHLDLPDGRRMHFGELSRGHASAVAMWAEVMLRVEAARLRADDPGLEPSGVILVDAPEADLDARLQRELLPALAELFPRIQLVVATHSPLVAMSLDDAVVYDLGRRRGRPSHEVRRGGIEALLVSMLGLEESPGGAPSPPAPSAPKRSAVPPPPPPKSKRAAPARTRNVPNIPSAPPPPSARQAGTGRDTGPLRASTRPPPPGKLPPKSEIPPARTRRTPPRRTTLGGAGPWAPDDES
jgi:predicted ATPase